jgi:hypothetical protein
MGTRKAVLCFLFAANAFIWLLALDRLADLIRTLA